MYNHSKYRRPLEGTDSTLVRTSGKAFLSALGPAVYAVKIPGGIIKIGYTTNPANRVQSLGLGSKSLLAMLFNGTRADEQAIHARLKGHAVKGLEWYSDTDPDVIAVVNEMRATMGLGPSPRLTTA